MRIGFIESRNFWNFTRHVYFFKFKKIFFVLSKYFQNYIKKCIKLKFTKNKSFNLIKNNVIINSDYNKT